MRGQDELREVGGLDSSVWDRQLVGENLKSQQTVAPGTLRLSRHSCRKQGDGRVGRPLTENAELGQLEVPPGLGCVAAADTKGGRYHWGFQLPGAWVCLNPQHRERKSFRVAAGQGAVEGCKPGAGIATGPTGGR